MRSTRSIDTVIKAQFYDLDPMDIVWHGNYARFLEQARCELLERIDFSYVQMKASGYAFPIVHLGIKYVKPLRMGQAAVVNTRIVDYENRLKLAYLIRDRKTSDVLTRAETVQVAVVIATGELCLESPAILIEKVRAWQ